MAFLARVGVAANQAFTRQTLATARAGQKIGAHWRPDGSIDFPNEWQALIFLSQHQYLVHGEDHQHDCREEHCRRGRHYQSESESESRKVSFLYNSITLGRSTTLRDVADEPRIMIMFISLPGTKRWLSARWEATTSSASSEDEEHCITYTYELVRDCMVRMVRGIGPTSNKHKVSHVAPNGTHSNKPQPIENQGHR